MKGISCIDPFLVKQGGWIIALKTGNEKEAEF